MTIYQYGPWNTFSKEHMEQLGKLLLAFTLRFCHSRNDPFKANAESSTTLTALEELGASRTPTRLLRLKTLQRRGRLGRLWRLKDLYPLGNLKS